MTISFRVATDIVGHSLGGSTAALLTYVMREQKELSSASCVTFAPESGNEFITTIINGADLVPTFSAASVDDLRTEHTTSAWANDLKNQIEHTRLHSTVYRSASALGSQLQSLASARANVAGAGAILRPVSTGTQVVMKRAQTMARAALSRPSIELSSWSCMGPCRRPTSTRTRSNVGLNCESDVDYSDDLVGPGTLEDRITEAELWQQLEHELYDQPQGEGDDLAKEMREEEAEVISKMSERDPPSSSLNTR
ncbi:hypothetical protein AgCh_016350 [Apium graveolens]